MEERDTTSITLLKVSEAARILDVSEARAYELLRTGLLPCVRIGRQIRLNPDRLREFIESGGQGL